VTAARQGYLSSQTSAMHQPLKMLLAAIVSLVGPRWLSSQTPSMRQLLKMRYQQNLERSRPLSKLTGMKVCRSTSTGEAVAFASEKGLDPIHNRSHTRGAPQVAVDYEPILARGFGHRRGNTFEQRISVRDKTRENPAPRPGAYRREVHRHVGGTERHRSACLSDTLLDPAGHRKVPLLLRVGDPITRLGADPAVYGPSEYSQLGDV
jgi:hypothetical protein